MRKLQKLPRAEWQMRHCRLIAVGSYLRQSLDAIGQDFPALRRKLLSAMASLDGAKRHHGRRFEAPNA